MNYDLVLEAYSISELLELNDKTDSECLEYLVESSFIRLPEVLPLEL